MATNDPPTAQTENTGNRRDRVMLGPLPDDFLQMNGGPVTAPINYHPAMFGGFNQNGGILNLTVVQARLAKNYGLTRMDPFCKIRVGAQVFETPTAYNGSKTPRWNKMLQSQVPDSISDIYIELYDERTFSIDERIAWGLVKLKDEVLQGKVVDEWYNLSGKQGEGKEGMIQLIMEYKKGVPPMMVQSMMGAPMMVQQPFPGYMYGYPPVTYAHQGMVRPPLQINQQQQQLQQQQLQQQQQQQQQPQQQVVEPPIASIGQINEKDLKTLKEMCPDLDDDIIRSVYQQTGGNLDRAGAQLLEMYAS